MLTIICHHRPLARSGEYSKSMTVDVIGTMCNGTYGLSGCRFSVRHDGLHRMINSPDSASPSSSSSSSSSSSKSLSAPSSKSKSPAVDPFFFWFCCCCCLSLPNRLIVSATRKKPPEAVTATTVITSAGPTLKHR